MHDFEQNVKPHSAQSLRHMKSPSETELSRPVRTTLAQLHYGYCQQLNSYLEGSLSVQTRRIYAQSVE